MPLGQVLQRYTRYPVSYHYKDSEKEGCIAFHIYDALTASNERFYSKVITRLLSQFCISKVEKQKKAF